MTITMWYGGTSPPLALATAVADMGIDLTPNMRAKNVGTVADCVTWIMLQPEEQLG